MQASWVRTGGICGLLGIASYLLCVLVPMPDAIGRLLFFAFPMLLAVSCIGTYVLLRAQRDSVMIQVGALFCVVGAVICNVMAVVQNSSFFYANGRAPKPADAELAQVVKWTTGAVHSVQLGLDISWDIFFGVGLLLFAIAMLRHPRFGRVFGGIGIAVIAALLVLNMAAFPVPPNPDLGPLVALWATFMCVQMLRSVGWVAARTSGDVVAASPPAPEHQHA